MAGSFFEPEQALARTSRGAQRSRSKAEYAVKLNIALMELEESLYWLELLDEGMVAPNLKHEISSLQVETGELSAIFVTFIKLCRKGAEAQNKRNSEEREG